MAVVIEIIYQNPLICVNAGILEMNELTPVWYFD
jgi:hypothetical protein